MILVTGATGFLGRRLIARLRDHTTLPVRALVRHESDALWLKAFGVELAFGDVTDFTSVRTAMRGVRQVIHAAGLFRFWGQPENFERVNVGGTVNMLKAAVQAPIERFVLVSTAVVIGEPLRGQVVDEHHPLNPRDPYQRSKAKAEAVVQEYVHNVDLPAVILRPGAFYGPGGRYAWNRLFFDDPLIRGLRVQVFNGRRHTFPIYIDDVADLIFAAIQRGCTGEVYLAADAPITHREVNALVSEAAGISPWRVNVPSPLMLAAAQTMTWGARLTGEEPFYPINLRHYVFPDWRIDSSKARRELGWTPTPIEHGIAATIEWYRKMNLLD